MGFMPNNFKVSAESMKQQISLRDDFRKVELVVFVLVLLRLTLVCSDACAQDASASQGQPTHHMFTSGYTGKAGTADGALRASVHTFKAEDGTPVSQSDEWYKSPSEAGSALDKLTKRASHVIKQGTKKDAKGRVIGKRVELVFSRGRKTSPEKTIAWSDGARIVLLSSTSLPLLLDFESQFYP
jgi:hypothetical protein